MNRYWLSATLAVICLAFALPAGAAEFHVSASGNDWSGNGSQGWPWRTIQKAADVMSAGDTCHVMDGEYAEMVRPPRSGAAGRYISFVAEGQSAELNGARRITGWTAHSGSIWKANAAWDFGELFVDRQRMVIARWPNLTSGDIYRPNFYQATANAGASYTTVIVSTTNNGSYAWTFPNTPSASCLVRVSDASNAAVNDVSNAAFNLQIFHRVRQRLSSGP